MVTEWGASYVAPAVGAQTEAVTASEAVAASQDAAPSQAESVTSTAAQDATSSGAAIGDIAESVTAADVSTGALAGATDIVDSVTSSDSVGVAVVDSVGVNETLVLSTSINAILSGLPVISLRFWRIKKWDTATGKYIPVTGITPLYSMIRPSDRLNIDLLDGVFKSFSGCSLPKDTMIPFDAVNYPGMYYYLLQSEQFNLNEQYLEIAEYYGTDNYFAEAMVLYVNGVEQLGGLNATQQANLYATPATTLAALRARVVDGAITGDQFDRALLAYIAGKRSGLVVAGVPTLEQYMGQSGTTPMISFSPTDAAGNGTPVIGA